MDESHVATACDALARALGYTVESYSDVRKVRTAPGLPDRRYVKRGVVLWCELKAPGKKMSEDQHRFLTSELEAGGMASCIEDVAQLRALFVLLARRSSIVDAEVRRRCAEQVRLVADRGYRDVRAAGVRLAV